MVAQPDEIVGSCSDLMHIPKTVGECRCRSRLPLLSLHPGRRYGGWTDRCRGGGSDRRSIGQCHSSVCPDKNRGRRWILDVAAYTLESASQKAGTRYEMGEGPCEAHLAPSAPRTSLESLPAPMRTLVCTVPWLPLLLRFSRQYWHCVAGRPFFLTSNNGRSVCVQPDTRCPLMQVAQANFLSLMRTMSRVRGRSLGAI